MFTVFSRRVWGWLGYAWGKMRVCFGYVKGLVGARIGFVEGTFWVLFGYVCGRLVPCLRYDWGLLMT